MVSGIYCIENKINNKKYIGQSIDIDRRWQEHKNELNRNAHANQYLQNAWNKYDAFNFDFYIIKACKPFYLDRFEKLYIKKYDTYNNGYNLDTGGHTVLGFLGHQHSDETKKLISEIKKNQYKGKGNPMYGKNHLLESKIKTSKKMNTTGFFRVSKHLNKRNTQGFYWEYSYKENGKVKTLSSVDIDKLKQRVLKSNLPWIEY